MWVHCVFGTFKHLQDGAVVIEQDARDAIQAVA